MLIPTIPGWKVETIGDDIAWMKFGKDGRLYAINPEHGFFGVAPGTSMKSNRNAMLTVMKHAIFTNCAMTPEGDIWWEGMTEENPRNSWTGCAGIGRRSIADEKRPIPMRASLFPPSNVPALRRSGKIAKGVPIDAILFGGRRGGVVPLVTESFNWQHGTFLAATTSSETTAAAAGKVGQLRRDPMAMLPFCGYNMGDYFSHWLKIGQRPGAVLPKIFYVNWFRQDDNGKFMWPGYGENSRVLKWIFERCDGTAPAVETPIGRLPAAKDLDMEGITVPAQNMAKLLSVDVPGWMAEVPLIRQYFEMFGDRLPQGLRDEVEALQQRLQSAKVS